MSENQNIRYRAKRVPQEGGFGVVVLLGVALPAGLVWSLFVCFGMIFNDFLTSIGEGTSAMALIMGLCSISLSTSALFVGTLNHILSNRKIALLGAALFVLGSLMQVFVNSLMHLIVSFGIVLGCGVGFMIPAAYATLNEYFIERRVLIMTIGQTLTCIISTVYPIAVQFSMNKFGFRGTLALITAINTHALLGMLTLQPAKWHYKAIKIPYCDAKTEERHPFLKQTNVIDKTDNLVMTCANGGDAKDKNDIENNKFEILTEDARNGSDTIKNGHQQTASKNGSVAALQRNKPGKWNKVYDFLYLALLKDIVYVNISLGVALTIFSDGYFFMFLPMYLYELNISKDDAALLLSIAGGFDLGCRLFSSIMSFYITVNARYMSLFGVVMTILFRFVFLYMTEFMGLAIVLSILGFSKTFFQISTQLVFAEHLPTEKFAAGYGLFMFLQGVIQFLLGPLIGWTRDTTQSYVICLHALTLIMAICAVFWFIEFAWFHLNGRKVKTTS